MVDGPDGETQDALGAITDARLLVIQLEQSLGGSDARNAGVNVASGDWIAFLDDDDEWLLVCYFAAPIGYHGVDHTTRRQNG